MLAVIASSERDAGRTGGQTGPGKPRRQLTEVQFDTMTASGGLKGSDAERGAFFLPAERQHNRRSGRPQGAQAAVSADASARDRPAGA